MKQLLLSLTFLLTITTISQAQDRCIARGAEPGELYLTTFWYGIHDSWGPPFYDTLRTALYRISNHGQNVTIRYDVDYFADYYTTPGSLMQPQYILADATPGVLYAIRTYEKNYYDYTQLWVSFDYGKSWVFREENIGSKGYYAANVEGLIYRHGTDGAYNSEDYGLNFSKIEIVSAGLEPGLLNGEAFSAGANDPYQGRLLHTYNFYNTYTQVPIDSEYMFGQVEALFPDVYRGGIEGEVYIDSWFPEYPGKSYKASFSADTGHTFRHVYVNENYQWQNSLFDKNQLLFMSDREPGVFYILHLNEVKDTDPYGWHLELCIEYYRDYGETLVATYCHDINKDYENETCEPVDDLVSEKINDNSLLLSWTKPAEGLEIKGYRIYRDNKLLTSALVTTTSYLDENLPIGNYNYYVVTHYTTGCVSDSSNHVMETIEVRVQEFDDGVAIFPNPTNGQLIITNFKSTITNFEIYNSLGKSVETHNCASLQDHTIEINISKFNTGIYFLKITTEKGIVTKKIIKK